jgi:hypothetical protein
LTDQTTVIGTNSLGRGASISQLIIDMISGVKKIIFQAYFSTLYIIGTELLTQFLNLPPGGMARSLMHGDM